MSLLAFSREAPRSTGSGERRDERRDSRSEAETNNLEMPRVGRVLIFDVLTQNTDANTATGRNEIRLIPKHIFPVNLINVIREFASNSATRHRFDVVDEFG
jgi:hypothetical protein